MKINEKGDFVFEKGDLVEVTDFAVNEWSSDIHFKHRRGFAIILGQTEIQLSTNTPDSVLYDVYWQESQQFDKICAIRFKEYQGIKND